VPSLIQRGCSCARSVRPIRSVGMPGRNAWPVAANIAQLAPTTRERPVVLPTRHPHHRAARKVSARRDSLSRAAHPLRAMARRCTIRTRGQYHQDASVGPGGIPKCWGRGMPGRLHNGRTHPADLHPGRTQDDLRAQQRLMVQGRLGGWLLRASVRSLRTAPLAHSSGEARPEGGHEKAAHPLRAKAGCIGWHPVAARLTPLGTGR
jgi:hypothetical protein